MKEFTCEQCHSKFMEYPANRNKKHVYCSKPCVNKSKEGHTPWNKGNGDYMVGCKNHFYGKKHDQVALEKISLTGKGRKPWNKGVKQWEGKTSPRQGTTQSLETRTKISKAVIGRRPWNYRGSIGRTERQIAMKKKDYLVWRVAVFTRDDYTCKSCGIRGGNLEADHIKSWRSYPELRYAIDNGRTLCRQCHILTPTWGGKSIRKDGGLYVG